MPTLSENDVALAEAYLGRISSLRRRQCAETLAGGLSMATALGNELEYAWLIIRHRQEYKCFKRCFKAFSSASPA